MNLSITDYKQAFNDAGIEIKTFARRGTAENPIEEDTQMLLFRKRLWTPLDTVWDDEQRILLPDGLQAREFGHLMMLRLKDKSATVIPWNLQEAIGDFAYYRKEEEVHEDYIEAFVVCEKAPDAQELSDWGYEQTEHIGYYVSTLPFFDRIQILVLTEMPNTPHNNTFRHFFRDPQVDEFAYEILMNETPLGSAHGMSARGVSFQLREL
ncbi:MAG: hypothetical protein AAF639_26275 [Chloroflexota bacterium]